jgi:hypothetical protein
VREGGHDGTHVLVLEPRLWVRFDRKRAWHRETVQVHGDVQFVADGTKAQVHIVLEPGGQLLATIDATIDKGSIQVEHTLDWKIDVRSLDLCGVKAVLDVPSYGARAFSPLLELDVMPFVVSA